MPAFQLTNDQVQQIADNQLEKQIILESSFRNDIIDYFDEINEISSITFIESGSIINVNQIFFNDIKELLLRNYKKIAQQFNSTIRESLIMTSGGQSFDFFNTQELTDNFIELDLGNRANEQASIINNTTQTQLRESFNNSLIESDQSDSLRDISESAILSFSSLSDSRIESIPMTETQGVVESTKSHEAEALLLSGAIIGGVVITNEIMEKTWITMLDDRVRKAHMLAHGQTVKNSSVFLVNNEELRFPRDASLGASLDNIINCRCKAIRRISFI